MHAVHLHIDEIIRAINGHVSTKGGDYASWAIGRREGSLAHILAGQKSIPLVDSWNCSYQDAQSIVDHFVQKGMKLDDGPLQINAARGVYIYQQVS